MTRSIRRKGGVRAFTLIEIMAAMAVLAIVVLMLGRILNDTSRAWEIGSREGESAALSRALLALIATDLSSAIAGPEPGMGFTTTTNSIAFVRRQPARSGSGTNHRRGLRAIRYELYSHSDIPNQTDFQTMRMRDANLWGETGFPSAASFNSEPIYYYIREFRVQAYDDNGQATTFTNSPVLPAWVDLYLAVVTDTDAVGFADMTEQQRLFRTQRFSTRVFFPQRTGLRPETY